MNGRPTGLSHDQVIDLHRTVVSAGLISRRDALLGGIDPNFVASILHAPNPGAQILNDLHALNREYCSRSVDPLRCWLQNAIALVSARVEADTFNSILDTLCEPDNNESDQGAKQPAAGASAKPVDLATLILSPRECSVVGLRILVVDDDESLLRFMERQLSRAGAIVAAAQHAEDALSHLSAQSIDIVCSDVFMHGVDGFELLETIQLRRPDLPVVLISGWITKDAPEGASAADFLQKPIGAETLIRRLDNAARGGLRRFALRTWPDGNRVYRLLIDVAEEVEAFIEEFGSQDQFEVALRHKMRELVHSFSRDSVDGRPAARAAQRLLMRVRRISDIMRRVSLGRMVGLRGYFESVRADLREDRPELRVEVDVSDDFSDPELANISNLFLVSGIELIDNATDALLGKGKIRLRARTSASSRKATLRVWSSSAPVPGEIAETIFEEGVSTKGDGRGLGLAIIKRLVERFGGTIRLQQDDRGVEFALAIPM